MRRLLESEKNIPVFRAIVPVLADKAQVQGGFVWQLFVAVRDCIASMLMAQPTKGAYDAHHCLFIVLSAVVAIGAEMPTTRIPTASDLPAILELTRENRTLLAELEPDFWRKSANADESHRAFVTYQISNEELTKRVLE